jgi:hypothetical protein
MALYQVRDHRQLNALIEEWIQAEGSARRLASRVDLHASDITRLISGDRKAITSGTFVALLRYAPRAQRPQLAAAFLSPEARNRIDRHDEWREDKELRLRGAVTRPGELDPVRVVNGRVIPEPPLPSVMLAAASDGYLGLMRIMPKRAADRPALAIDVLAALLSTPYAAYFKSFRKQLQGRDAGWMQEDAELEAVAPLASAGVNGGITASAWELHLRGQLGPYLDAALKVQALLATEDSVLSRAHNDQPMPSRSNPLGIPAGESMKQSQKDDAALTPRPKQDRRSRSRSQRP